MREQRGDCAGPGLRLISARTKDSFSMSADHVAHVSRRAGVRFQSAASLLGGALLLLAIARPAAARSLDSASEDDASEQSEKLGTHIKQEVREQLVKVRGKLEGLADRLHHRRGDNDDEEEDWYARGMRQHKRGHYKDAIAAFQKAIDADQRADDASYNIACDYAQLGDVEHAVEWLKRATEEGADAESMVGSDDDFDPIRRDAKFRAGLQELHAQRANRHASEQARLSRRYQRLAARAPKSEAPWSSLGHELLDAGAYDLAVKSFSAAAERTGEPGNDLYNAACALSLKGDKKAALAQLQQAIEQGFDDLHLLKRDDDLDGVRDEAQFTELTQLARDLELDVERNTFVLNLGSVHVWTRKSSKKRNAEDVAHYQEMAKKHPQVGRAQFNLGYAQLAAKDAAGAEASFTKALSLGYRNGTTLYDLACAQARAGHKDAALDSLQKSIDAHSDAADSMDEDEDLASLRGDARFRELKRKADQQSGNDDDDDDE
jgi:tetratricopeptide (TPR) repeat protein